MGETRAPQARRACRSTIGAENGAHLRVAFLNQFYVPDLSPTAHLCASLAEHRAQLGDDVTVITSRAGYLAPVGEPSDDRGVRVLRVQSTRLGSRSRLSRLIDWATFYLHAIVRTALLPKQDVIVALTTPPFIALAGLLHKTLHPTTRLVLWNMDCYPEALERTGMIAPGGFIARTMRAVNRAIFHRIDHLVALDRAMADLLLSQYQPRGMKIPCEVIPNWERASLFAEACATPWHGRPARADNPSDPQPTIVPGFATPQHGRDARATGAPASPGFTILYLGNAGYGHEFQTMLEAAELLKDQPVTFRFIGGGARREWLVDEQRRRGLPNITFDDYVPKDQTPAVMRAADCALITLEDPMRGVMSPSKLHSNLAMGLPILYVGPEGANVDEAIRRFGCGVSLRIGQARQMADFIQTLSRNPSLHFDLRRRAREAFEKAYCDEQTLPRFDQILSALRNPAFR